MRARFSSEEVAVDRADASDKTVSRRFGDHLFLGEPRADAGVGERAVFDPGVRVDQHLDVLAYGAPVLTVAPRDRGRAVFVQQQLAAVEERLQARADVVDVDFFLALLDRGVGGAGLDEGEGVVLANDVVDRDHDLANHAGLFCLDEVLHLEGAHDEEALPAQHAVAFRHQHFGDRALQRRTQCVGPRRAGDVLDVRLHRARALALAVVVERRQGIASVDGSADRRGRNVGRGGRLMGHRELSDVVVQPARVDAAANEVPVLDDLAQQGGVRCQPADAELLQRARQPFARRAEVTRGRVRDHLGQQ